MQFRYVVELPLRKPKPIIGRKAQQLNYLLQQDVPVPGTWVCTEEAHLRFQEGDDTVLEQIQRELSSVLDPDKPYAVRSSANLEDGSERTFAGQFTTTLNVQGIPEILQALQTIWESAESPEMSAYLEANGVDAQDIKMSVILQEMVSPLISGVAFSVNPVTGMDEIVVEAVAGSGETLVQGGVTPLRWVHKWGAWIQEPDQGEIDPEIITRVVHATKQLARAYGHPLDLEWVYDGQTVHWVQLREVTALDIPVYSNHISREVFPGLIKPLIWSINVPLVNGAWVRLFTEMIGPNDIEPHSLAQSFFSRAYFDMGTIGRIFELLGFPRESLELLMGLEIGGPDKPSFKPSRRTFALLPRMLWFMLGKLRFGARVERYLPQARETYREIHAVSLSSLSEEQLLEHIDFLFHQVRETAYFNIVTPLMMQLINQILNAQLRRREIDPQTVNVVAGLKDYHRYEPHFHLGSLHRQYQALSPALQARLKQEGTAALNALDENHPFQKGFQAFTRQFGHLSDSGNDFSAVPWREDPDLILTMIIQHHSQQESGAGRRFDDLNLSRLTRLVLFPLYRRARRFRLLREAVGSLYTYGYGLFREAFLTFGDRFAERGIIPEQEDVFYLTWEEIKQIAQDEEQAPDIRDRIKKRKQEMETHRKVTPPSVIYGEETAPVSGPSSSILKGTATSRGRYTGPVRVVRGIGDLDKVGHGDVLVVPFSDVGWTPLFARAGAVVAESGGILSHSSIIAREYGIPAVVAVQGACALPDDLAVTVDGYQGEVILPEERENPKGG